MESKYDILRRRAQQTVGAQQQQESDVLKRRFSALGMGGSGNAIKAEMQSQEKARDQLAQTSENIGFQEAAEQERKAETEANRKFAREERLGSEKFSSGESALARRFAADEANRMRKFQTSERLGSQEFSAQQARYQADLQTKMFYKQLKQQNQQFNKSMAFEDRKFLEEIRVNDFNMKMAAKMANEKGMFDKLLNAHKDVFGWMSGAEPVKRGSQGLSGSGNTVDGRFDSVNDFY